jgi:predicted small lipoprotein YifL
MSQPPIKTSNAVLAIGALLLTSACGQKGPLFLPGDPSEIRTEVPPQQAQPAPAEAVEDEDDEDEDFEVTPE